MVEKALSLHRSAFIAASSGNPSAFCGDLANSKHSLFQPTILCTDLVKLYAEEDRVG